MILKNRALRYNLQLEAGEPLSLPDDPPPIPDAMFQNPSFHYAYYTIESRFHGRADAFVDSNTFVYYDRSNRNRRLTPDCCVALGVDAEAIRRRNGYVIWEVGKPPDFALEIASETTASRDMREKRRLYAEIGVGEHWRFDPSGGDYYGEALIGETLVDGEYRRMDTLQGESGEMWAHSPTLGLDFCRKDEILRVYDPATDEYLRYYAEFKQDYAELAQAYRESEEARRDTEAENRRLREQIRRLRGC